MKKNKTTRLLIVTAVVALVGAAAYAFTASNTFSGGNAGSAGSGSGAISGYAVSNIAYTNSGTNFATVAFDLDKAAGTVSVSFDGGVTNTACSNGGSGNHWSCTVGDAIGPATSLTVTALQ
jgi:hypothetical protein